MSLNQNQLDEVLQTHGPVVSRIIRRQFASLPEDVVDLLVVETIARVSIHLLKQKEPVTQGYLLALITRSCQNRAIDHLRRRMNVTTVRSEVLETVTQQEPRESSRVSSELIGELVSLISALDAVDRRILRAAMYPPSDGDWARELALEQLNVEGKRDACRSIDAKELSKLCGRLRVRKHRLLQKLRKALEARGYSTGTFSEVLP